jgi:TatD DNase family protein
MLTDTHAHLNASLFQDDQEIVIQRAKDEGVSMIVNVGFNRETISSSIALTEQYDFIYSSIGWHPQDVIDMQTDDLNELEQLSAHEKVIAIGEIGLDYYRDGSAKEVQQRLFREQIQLARKVNLPIIIHDREAHQDIVRILKEERAYDVGGIMHCFSGSWEMAKACLDMNFYISFGGPITYKNAKQPKEVLAKVPLERLLIETDCPYLTPHPYRGTRNESSYLKIIAQSAAEIRGIHFEELAAVTTENAKRLLFPIK